jgi:hypothetical protein
MILVFGGLRGLGFQRPGACASHPARAPVPFRLDAVIWRLYRPHCMRVQAAEFKHARCTHDKRLWFVHVYARVRQQRHRRLKPGRFAGLGRVHRAGFARNPNRSGRRGGRQGGLRRECADAAMLLVLKDFPALAKERRPSLPPTWSQRPRHRKLSLWRSQPCRPER